MLLFLIVVWFLLGLLCYKLAERKGRDRNWAFFMGFVFGLLAVIYYLCCGEMAECPKCGKKISASSRICLHCKAKIQ